MFNHRHFPEIPFIKIHGKLKIKKWNSLQHVFKKICLKKGPNRSSTHIALHSVDYLALSLRPNTITINDPAVFNAIPSNRSTHKNRDLLSARFNYISIDSPAAPLWATLVSHWSDLCDAMMHTPCEQTTMASVLNAWMPNIVTSALGPLNEYLVADD